VVFHNMVVFLVLRLCSVLRFFRCWRSTYFLHLQGAVKFQIDEDGQRTYNVTLRLVCITIVALRRHCYVSWVCVCSLRYPAWNARVCHILLSPVVCLAVPHFSTLSCKQHDFWEKVIVHKMYVLIFSLNLSETFLILRRNQWDVVINICSSSCKIPLFLSHINETWISLTDF
jgi:hypothetical protein